MNRILRLYLFATLVMSLTSGVCLGQATAQSTPHVVKPFPDVPKDHWAYQAVMELQQKGILIGYPDGTFNGETSKVVPVKHTPAKHAH